MWIKWETQEYTAKFRLGSPQLLAFSDQLELLRAMTQNDEIYLALVRRDICNRRNHVNGYFDQMNLVIAFCSEYELLYPLEKAGPLETDPFHPVRFFRNAYLEGFKNMIDASREDGADEETGISPNVRQASRDSEKFFLDLINRRDQMSL